MHRAPSRLASLVTLALALAAPALAQQTHRVPQDFPTVQAAIDASNTGDTVLVSPGTYTENLILTGKSISLLSTAGSATTILDGNQAAPVLTITSTPAASTTVSGFTLQHGLATSSSHAAAGVFLAQAAATLSNNQLVNNSGDDVGVFFGSVSILNSSLSTAPSTFGSGCDGGNGVTVTGATPIRDPAGNTVPIVISGNTIFGNSTSCSGTGIVLSTDSFNLPHLISNNIIRDSTLGLRLSVADGITLLQNLVYDNLQGAMELSATTTPSTDPAQTFLINNTVHNNLNSPDPNDLTPAEIHLIGTAATTAFINNILVGTTPYPVILCDSATPTFNNTPLLLDHTDVYNTTQNPSGFLAGDCSHGISNQLATFGNLSVDPAFVSSTNLHLTPASPARDAGTNSAPQLLPTDLDGNPRIADASNQGTATIDLGAYELSGSVDSTPATLTLSSSVYLTPAATILLTTTASIPSGAIPSGSVTFLQNGAPLSTVSIDATGTATLYVPLSTLGVYGFTATLAPATSSPAPAPTVSPVLFVDVTTTATPAAATSLTLSAAPSSVTTAQTTQLTIHLASIPASSTVPSGTVVLADNGAPFQTLTPDPISGQATFLTTFPVAGTHLLTASYAGSAQYTAASASTTLTVASLLPTTLALSATPASPTAGQLVTLVAHLGSTTLAGAPGPIPPGALTLYDGTSLLTTLQPDPTGLATYNLPASASGAHTYSLRYAGTTIYGPASSTLSLTLPSSLATTLQLAPSTNPATLNTLLSLTATVSTSTSSIPTGSVRFADGTTTLTTLPLTSGQATFTSSTLALGNHSLTATYLPADGSFSTSQTSLAEAIQGIPTQLSANSGTAVSGQPISLLATASTISATPVPIAPSGVLTVTEGANLLTTVPLSPNSATTGTASLNLSFTTTGTHTVTLHFAAPSGDFLPSQTQITEVITAVPPILTTLSASSSSPTVNSTLSLTASVSSAQALPASSTLTFLDGSTPLFSANIPISGGALTFSTSTLTVGAHSLSVVVHDSTGTLLSTSNTLPITVLGLPSSLSFTANPAPYALATAPVTLTAALSSSIASTHTAAGSILFLDGSTTLGTSPLDPTGHATLTLPNLSPGPHSLSATFAGDNLLRAANSQSLVETILPNPTSLTLSVSTTSTTAFQPVIYRAAVTSPTTTTPLDTAICSPACVPTTVTFTSGSTLLGVSPLDPTGHAILTLAPHAGTLVVTASFSGSPLFSPSTSASVGTSIAPAPTNLTLLASPNPLYQNESTVLTATLTPSIPSSVAAPPLVSPITITQVASTLATLSTSPGFVAFTPSGPGTFVVTATYSGSPDLAPASATISLSVLASDLTLSIRDTALTLPTTHHTATSVTLVASGAMSDTVDLACPNAPFLVTCTFTPSTIPVSADGSSPGTPVTTITVAIDTDFILNWASLRTPSGNPHAPYQPLGPHTPNRGSSFFTLARWPSTCQTGNSCMAGSQPSNLYQTLRSLPALSLAIPSGLLCCVLLPLSRRRLSPSTPLPRLLALILLAASTLALSACSGQQPGHTPPGTYDLTITAHARSHNLTRTTHLQLTISPK